MIQKSTRRLLYILIVCAAPILISCTHLFFQPTKTVYPTLQRDFPDAELIHLISADGTQLNAMKLHAKKIDQQHRMHSTAQGGVILQFHGNAQNMTSHYQFVSWLTDHGYDVLTFDYRGYGLSQGSAKSDFNNILKDCQAALKWADEYAAKIKRPLFVIGQSLGGTLALRTLEEGIPSNLKLLVIDSSFYSFRSIAREKLKSTWITLPLSLLAPFLVSDFLSPGPILKKIAASSFGDTPLKKLPALFLHSKIDPVVSQYQEELLFDVYPGPKERWILEKPGHIRSLTEPDIRVRLLKKFETLYTDLSK